jgi:hypothetical protein
MKLLLLLVVLALIALAVWMLLTSMSRRRGSVSAAAVWEVVTRTRDDGTYVVAVRGSGGERVVRELPPALEGVELTSELRLAREEAQMQADELNRVQAP